MRNSFVKRQICIHYGKLYLCIGNSGCMTRTTKHTTSMKMGSMYTMIKTSNTKTIKINPSKWRMANDCPGTFLLPSNFFINLIRRLSIFCVKVVISQPVTIDAICWSTSYTWCEHSSWYGNTQRYANFRLDYAISAIWGRQRRRDRNARWRTSCSKKRFDGASHISYNGSWLHRWDRGQQTLPELLWLPHHVA